MIYSSSTGGFYDTAVHGDSIPTDAVEISQEKYEALFQGQRDGMVIVSDDNGYPMLSSPPTEDPAALAKIALDNKVQIATQQIAIIKPARRWRLRQAGAHPAAGRLATLPLRADAGARTNRLARVAAMAHRTGQGHLTKPTTPP